MYFLRLRRLFFLFLLFIMQDVSSYMSTLVFCTSVSFLVVYVYRSENVVDELYTLRNICR